MVVDVVEVAILGLDEWLFFALLFGPEMCDMLGPGLELSHRILGGNTLAEIHVPCCCWGGAGGDSWATRTKKEW